MLLTEDNHVIEALSAYGSDKALSIGILPGRPRCCEHLVDADAPATIAFEGRPGAVVLGDFNEDRQLCGCVSNSSLRNCDADVGP
jgi:hypothetical protein